MQPFQVGVRLHGHAAAGLYLGPVRPAVQGNVVQLDIGGAVAAPGGDGGNGNGGTPSAGKTFHVPGRSVAAARCRRERPGRGGAWLADFSGGPGADPGHGMERSVHGTRRGGKRTCVPLPPLKMADGWNVYSASMSSVLWLAGAAASGSGEKEETGSGFCAVAPTVGAPTVEWPMKMAPASIAREAA